MLKKASKKKNPAKFFETFSTFSLFLIFFFFWPEKTNKKSFNFVFHYKISIPKLNKTTTKILEFFLLLLLLKKPQNCLFPLLFSLSSISIFLLPRLLFSRPLSLSIFCSPPFFYCQSHGTSINNFFSIQTLSALLKSRPQIFIFFSQILFSLLYFFISLTIFVALALFLTLFLSSFLSLSLSLSFSVI